MLDVARRRVSGNLRTNKDRIEGERLALRIALGTASGRVVLSYPRFDADQARPRVPSFYGLEVLRAAEGVLPGFRDLADRAHEAGGARMRWPGPEDATTAIDGAEYDLAVLEALLKRPAPDTKGAAHYLLQANTYLARALRFRARRWGLAQWTRADGLLGLGEVGRLALARHSMRERAYSATGLQSFAPCPYRFYLRTILRLAPRDEVEPIEELDTLQRGRLIHEVQFRVLSALRDAGARRVNGANLQAANDLLEELIDEIAARYHDDLAPAIERVWIDGIALIRRDLRHWLEGLASSIWEPERFELAFGLGESEGRDPASRVEPVDLDCGIRLRGAIDMVERHGNELRATDNKTGKRPPPRRVVIGGGETLQPVLYALALEKLFPDSTVTAGRLHHCTDRGDLHHCTDRGDFHEEVVPLDDAARCAAGLLASSIESALSKGFLPAAPRHDACTYCDYSVVCGPYEELRTRRKHMALIAGLERLRKAP